MFPSSETQNELINVMINLQHEMSMYLSFIEQEKLKFPPNLGLIQFYINCHSQRMQEFEIRIPYLPLPSHTVIPLNTLTRKPQQQPIKQCPSTEQITVKLVYMDQDTGEIDASKYELRQYPRHYEAEHIRIAVIISGISVSLSYHLVTNNVYK